MLDARHGVVRRAHPASVGDESDREIGARAAEADGVERARVQGLRTGLELRGVRAPAGDEVGRVEPRRDRDCVPQPLQVGLSEDLRRPPLVGRRDHRPVDPPSRDELERELADLPRLRAADESRVEGSEEVGIRVSGEGDQRRVLVEGPAVELEEVRCRPAELILRAELDRGSAEVEIPVVDDDVARAGPIRLARDSPRDLDVLDEAADDGVLTLLHVCAHAHGELRVAPQTFVGRQGVRAPDAMDAGVAMRRWTP